MTRYVTLQDFVAELASLGEAPALIAVSNGQASVRSFAALAREARRFADELARDRVGAGEPIAIVGPNSAAWAIAFLGVVASGAAAMPLDDRSSVEELRAALERGACRRAFVTRAHAERLRAAGWQGDVRFLEPAASAPSAGCDETVTLPKSAPGDVAVLAFTSGTTGTPKAVPLTHSNILANLEALRAERLIGHGDRALLPLPLHHVYPLTVGFMTPLASGAAVVLPSGVGGPELVEALQVGRATHMVGVPRLYEALLAGIRARIRARGRAAARLFSLMLWASIVMRRLTGFRIGRALFRGLHRQLASDLGLLACGGAALDVAIERTLEGLGWEVLTGYGLTETSPILTFNRRGAARPGSAGQPVAGVRVRIARPDAQGVGEIEVAGPSVFAGYRGDPAATRAAFSPDGWLRTGDLGTLDRGGYLRVVARAGETIVLPDGKKIFPETVESAYEQSRFIREVAILSVGGALAGLVVPDLEAIRRTGAERIEDRLRDELAVLGARLPPWQRLQGFAVTRTGLPRTHLGKIRRHLLPPLYAAARERKAEVPPSPLSQEDRALLADPVAARLWDWLSARYPGRSLSLDTSPQLDLGLDSLGWVGFTLELRPAVGIDLTEDAVARVVTLRDLLREAVAAASAPARKPVAADERWFRPRGAVRWTMHRLVAVLAWVVMRLIFRLSVEGLGNIPASGPCLICPNHASYLDPFAVAAALPYRVLRDTYWGAWTGRLFLGPLTRLFSWIVQAIPVDPDRAVGTSLTLGLSVLLHGKFLVWFPEGARSPTGELQKFHRGVGSIIAPSRVPTVPTLISGSFASWPRGKFLPRPGRITVRFGKAISADQLAATGKGETEPEKIADALHAAVAALDQHGIVGDV